MASELGYLLAGLRTDLAALEWTRSQPEEIGAVAAGSAVQY
jgi:hypothetical protein